MAIRAARVRNRQFSRLRHSRKLLGFLTAQAARLEGTGTGVVATFTNATDIVNIATHGYVDGQGPFLLTNSGGALPTGLAEATEYWINVADAGTFTLHPTEADGLAGTNTVGFSDNGTGTNSVFVGAEESDIFTSLLSGNSAAQIRGITSMDNA